MRKIKIAQIGTSRYSHGNDILNSLRKQKELFEVVGYVLPEQEKEKFPEKLKGFQGLREMTLEEILADPEIEAVTIETEEIYLSRYALMAAEHGKHIHMEKPGGVCSEDFTRLIQRIRQNRTVFHTGYMYRYNPCVKEALNMIREGKLGRIISVEAQMNTCHHSIERQWLENFPGGNMFFLGCHLVDFILQVKGMPEQILPLHRSTGIQGITSEDFAMAVLCYPDGNCMVKTAANEVGSRRHLVVSGTRGTLVIDPVELWSDGSGLQAQMKFYEQYGTTVQVQEINSEIFDRYDEMMASFAAIVRGEKENPWTLDYEHALYRTVLECCGASEK